MFVVCCLLFVICCLLFVVCYFVVCYFVVCYLLFVILLFVILLYFWYIFLLLLFFYYNLFFYYYYYFYNFPSPITIIISIMPYNPQYNYTDGHARYDYQPGYNPRDNVYLFRSHITRYNTRHKTSHNTRHKTRYNTRHKTSHNTRHKTILRICHLFCLLSILYAYKIELVRLCIFYVFGENYGRSSEYYQGGCAYGGW